MPVACVDCQCMIEIPLGMFVEIELERRELGEDRMEFLCEKCESKQC